MLTGVGLGFGAAIFQSGSYICGRLFTSRFGGRALVLLALSHIVMAGFSFAILPFFIAKPLPGVGVYLLNVVYCAVFYLAGQFCLFMALRHANASRVSPLLGLKVFILAMIGMGLMGQHFTFVQWAAIVMSICGAYFLSYTGEKMSAISIYWVLGACLCYCISDLNIKVIVKHFEYAGLMRASMTSVCLTYILCGVAGAAAMVWLPRPKPGMWAYSVPFAATWFVSMTFLFACFAQIGVVYGNIIQSSRGIISVVLGAVISSLGHVAIEQKVSRKVFLGRLAAAALITAAIALYSLG